MRTNVFNVAQRTYEYITAKDVETRLVTRNVNFCTVLIGVNSSRAQAFMCHLDFPTTANALTELISLIKDENGSLDGFQLYAVSMFPPHVRLLFPFLGVCFAYAIAGYATALACSFFLVWLFFWVQYKCWRIARSHFQKEIQWRAPWACASIFRTIGTAVDRVAPDPVEVWWDEKNMDMSAWKPKPYRFTAVRSRYDRQATSKADRES